MRSKDARQAWSACSSALARRLADDGEGVRSGRIMTEEHAVQLNAVILGRHAD
jgi:hypothetical protein